MKIKICVITQDSHLTKISSQTCSFLSFLYQLFLQKAMNFWTLFQSFLPIRALWLIWNYLAVNDKCKLFVGCGSSFMCCKIEIRRTRYYSCRYVLVHRSQIQNTLQSLINKFNSNPSIWCFSVHLDQILHSLLRYIVAICIYNWI